MPSLADRSQQVQEKLKIEIFQPAFPGAYAEDDFLLAAESTGPGWFRSADHRCSRHWLDSPEIEYFDWPRSKATAPSSSTTAPRGLSEEVLHGRS